MKRIKEHKTKDEKIINFNRVMTEDEYNEGFFFRKKRIMSHSEFNRIKKNIKMAGIMVGVLTIGVATYFSVDYVKGKDLRENKRTTKNIQHDSTNVKIDEIKTSKMLELVQASISNIEKSNNWELLKFSGLQYMEFDKYANPTGSSFKEKAFKNRAKVLGKYNSQVMYDSSKINVCFENDTMIVSYNSNDFEIGLVEQVDMGFDFEEGYVTWAAWVFQDYSAKEQRAIENKMKDFFKGYSSYLLKRNGESFKNTPLYYEFKNDNIILDDNTEIIFNESYSTQYSKEEIEKSVVAINDEISHDSLKDLSIESLNENINRAYMGCANELTKLAGKNISLKIVDLSKK